MTTIRTARLVLRPPISADAQRIVDFVSDFDIARMLARVPHPYDVADALWWIGTQATPEGRSHEEVLIASLDGELIGACSHMFRAHTASSEVGYWVGKPYWGRGYATEMTAALLHFGFSERGLQTTTVSHMTDNPASAAVIAKLGFRPTGRRVIECVARGAEVDVLTYALARAEALTQPWFGVTK